MKKRVLSFLVAAVMLLSITASIIPSVNADEALPSYNICDDFKSEVFSYGTRNLSDGTMTTMSWNETQKMYQSGSNLINSGFLSTGTDTAVCSVVTFTAPYTGKITVTSQTVLDAGYEVKGIVNRGKLWSSDYSVCYAQVYKNSFANQLANYSLPANNTPVVVDDIVDIEVTAGDRIMFMVGSNTAKNSYIEWLPDITYTEIAHDHTWAETMSSDADYHWYDCTAADCDITDNASKEGYGAHADADINGVCDVCGYAMPIVLAKYNLFNDFGNEVFGYSTRNVSNGTMTTMSWNETQKMYQSGSNYINAGFLSAGDDPAVCSVVTFTAPYTGKITITADSVVAGITNRGKLWSSDYAECYAQIFHNSFANGIMGYNLPANNTTLVVEDITMNVTAGDRIMFMVGSNTAKNSYIEWLPEIVYTEIAHSHVWAETMSSDEDYHWYDCTVEDCDLTDNASKEGYGAHADADINGVCDVCGYAMPIVLAKYNLFNDFGNEVFGYSTRNVSNGTMTAMSYNETQKMYQYGSNYINAGFLSAGDDPAVCSVVTFTAPYTGKITITADSVVAGITNRGKLWSSDYAECYAQIFHNSFANGIMGYNLPANNTTLVVEDITMNVTAGDRIMFMVGSNTAKNSYIEWLPEIVYNCILDAKVEEYNVSLGDDLNVNFVLDIAVEDVATTKVNVTVANTQTSYNAADLLVDGKYVVAAELAAAQMTEKVNVQIVTDDLQTFNKDYSVRQYADFILDEANGYSAEVKALVEAMLHYGAAAQGYFGVNTTTLANDGYTDTVTNEIPVLSDYSLLPTGAVDGITFYGASLLFKSKTAVRFYFSCDDASTYTFTIGSDSYTATEKGAGLWYVEIGEIVPQDLDAEITVVVSDAEGNELTVGYSPMHYIVRQFNKTADETLKVLLQNLYDYHVAAEALKAA